MTAPVSRLSEAQRSVSSIADLVEAGEVVDVYLERAASRRLSVAASGRRRLQAQDGRFGGYLRLEHGGRETYGLVGDASPAGLARTVSVGRRARRLSRPTPARQRLQHRFADGCWQNTPHRFDLPELAADPQPWLDAVGAELTGEQRITAMCATEFLRESVFARCEQAPHSSVCYGVEIEMAAAPASGGPASMVSRYAATAQRLDLRGLGRELRLVASRTADGPEFGGTSIVVTPSAAARLISGLASNLLVNVDSELGRVTAALVDDARNADGYAAQATDCEGTPTGRIDLVGMDGQPARLGIRQSRAAEAGSLTGHARWDPIWKQPRLRAANVFLDGHADPDRLLHGDRCVVVDVRPLGIAENQAGSRMTFRLSAVRAVDGEPAGSYAPFTVSGDVADFLTSVTDAYAPQSFFPGEPCCGGGYLALDTSGLDARSVL